ncbi:hypothetical protein Pcinc_023061 [Petrolisthes cinctipes]|uniref:Chitin-binding type-2 domain-containing protein n=1 Tax=Petrolisthes cinctipes TaxID=88211 RepID=A0AAE1FD04_PETCI|nr:hypothetical protein Pcinc_023061 [Petrolisthes cinctipes]
MSSLVLQALGVTLVGGRACEPDCTGMDPGMNVADPKNCTRYYLCLSNGVPSDVALSCPTGQKFDTLTNVCMNESNSSLSCAICPPYCQFKCPPDNQAAYIAHPSDCNYYYMCGLGDPGDDPMLIECPVEIPYYDGEHDHCQADPELCCGQCAAFCYDPFTEVADPYDCTKFYLCTESSYYPGADDHFPCSPGENFDTVSGQCSALASCFQPCESLSATASPPTRLLQNVSQHTRQH